MTQTSKTLPLVLYPDKRLSFSCGAIKEITEEITQLAHDMAVTMYENNGVGLAAPQVGINLQLITVDCSNDRSELHHLINPKIIWESEAKIANIEGCLSFPDMSVQVQRSKEVEVEAMNLSGESVKISASGLLAICLQHEIDHLNGLTFLNRVTRQVRRHALRKWIGYDK